MISRRGFIGGALGALGASALGQAGERGPVFPYYSGRSDLDSTLAAIRMMLGTLNPEDHFPLPEVAQEVSHREGFWIFEAQLLPILSVMGYPAELVSRTPYHDLAAGKIPAAYGPFAREFIDREAVKWAISYSGSSIGTGDSPLSSALSALSSGKVVMISADRRVLRDDPALPYCRYNLVLVSASPSTITYHDPSSGPFRAAPIDVIGRAFLASDRAILAAGRQSSRGAVDKR